MNAPQGLHDFLRAYYHYKSGDWVRNIRTRSPAGRGGAGGDPTYYNHGSRPHDASDGRVGDADAAEIAANTWLPDDAYGLHRGIPAHRVPGRAAMVSDHDDRICCAELELFAGRPIDVPSLYLSGRRDWGIYQTPVPSNGCRSRRARG